MKRILAIITCVGVLALGCSKESSNEFVPYPNNELNDTAWNAIPASTAPVRKIHQQFQLPLSSDSISGSAGGVLIFNDKLMLYFPPNFCTTNNGTTVNDKVKIEIVQLESKGDMIRQNKPTMSYEELLITGGSMYIKASRNNESLKLAPGTKIQVIMRNDFTASNTSSNMSLFVGQENANVTSTQNFTWVPADTAVSAVNSTMFQSATGSSPAYSFFIDNFQWVNCDYFYSSTQPKTKITVSTPPNFTNTNTVVYAVFTNENIVAYLYDDAAKRHFYMTNAVIGKPVMLVSLSMINNQYYLGTKLVTIGPNMNVDITPELKTKQQIDSFLESL